MRRRENGKKFYMEPHILVFHVELFRKVLFHMQYHVAVITTAAVK